MSMKILTALTLFAFAAHAQVPARSKMHLASVPSPTIVGTPGRPGPVSRYEYIGLALPVQRMVPLQSVGRVHPNLVHIER